jgi:hypothetical protein
MASNKTAEKDTTEKAPIPKAPAPAQGIYTAINGIMSEIGAIGKEQKNKEQGFLYRGIDVVMNVLQPLLIKHKVFVYPEVLEQLRNERVTNKGGTLLYSVLKIKYTFCAMDGSSVTTTVIGEGMDSGDKASNKAMSIAFKYACFQVFCIPTEEMKDPDAETLPKSKEKPTPKQIAELGKLEIDINGVATYFKVKPEFLTGEQVQFAIDQKRKRLAAQQAAKTAQDLKNGEKPAPAPAPSVEQSKYQRVKELIAGTSHTINSAAAIALEMFGTNKINNLSDADLEKLAAILKQPEEAKE